MYVVVWKYGGEFYDIDFDGECDEWDYGFVGVDVEYCDFGGDYVVGVVFAVRVVYRGEDDLDYEVFYNVIVCCCVVDIVCV